MQINKVLMMPEDVISGGGLDSLNPDLILDELNKVDDTKDDEVVDDDDTKEELIKEDKDDDKDEDKDETSKEVKDELSELEEDLKEPTDEDLELKTPVQRRQLMKDYPDIFKKHPGLESTIYRERAYTELLPTIADAKSALEALQTLDRFEADLKQGKTVDMMKAVLADDPKGFAKLADTYMENLAQVDERAYHHVLGNITKDIVEAMVGFGKEKAANAQSKEEGQAILDAASTLYQFMFNSTTWQGKKKLAVDEVVDSGIASERNKLEKERKDFENSQINEHTGKLMTSIDNQVKGTIEKSIDPKDQMTPFVKSKAIEEVLKKATDLIKKDGRFQTIVKQLNEKFKAEKFSDEGKKRITSAYFTKYKAILVPIIQSVRKEALKGNNVRLKKDEEVNDTTERANRANQSGQNKGGNKNDSSKPKPGESYSEFLARA